MGQLCILYVSAAQTQAAHTQALTKGMVYRFDVVHGT